MTENFWESRGQCLSILKVDLTNNQFIYNVRVRCIAFYEKIKITEM